MIVGTNPANVITLLVESINTPVSALSLEACPSPGGPPRPNSSKLFIYIKKEKQN